MNCNKEEAFRAKALAENQMQIGDFVGAQALLLKAQRLFSDIDSLPQMLAVCDVHTSAEKKINGLENWYGILQVMHFSDDATIKKQVRKLSLLLHPDKNKFAGAEAAFKLVWEASRLLADKDKRSKYDIKRTIHSRIANQSNAHSGLQAAPAHNASDSIINNATFWTCCQHCGYRSKYPRKYVNTVLSCSSCQRSDMALDTGVPFNSSTDQKEVQNRGPCNTSMNKSVESTNAQPGSVAADMYEKGTLKEKFNKNYGEGESENAEVSKPKLEDESKKNCDASSRHVKHGGRMKNTAELQKPQPEVTEPETDTSKSVCDELVSRRDQPSVNKNKNKRKKFVEDPTESSNVDGSGIIENKEDLKLNNRRKSSRKTRQISYAEEGHIDDLPCPLRKKPRSSVEFKSEQTTEKLVFGVGSSERRDCGGSSVHSCEFKGEAKKNVDSEYPDISSTNDKESKGCELPVPDFNNFELTTSCFTVNQVWSVYDPTDGMPRFYVRIEKVFDSEFKVGITWIDPLHNNKDNSIPIACGIFQDADSGDVNDHLLFSCQIVHFYRNNNIVIYPRKGEIWAVFRGWDISWSTSSETHKRPYEYDYVEVLSEFSDEDGLGVAYLGKVERFVSLFRRDVQHGVLQLQIPPNEMLRFSHKVPSFKMTGKERGVPPGCFELDTAALPKDMFDGDGDDGGLDSKRRNSKTSGPFPEASKVEAQGNTSLESSPSLKKRQKIHDKYTSFSKASDNRCASHKINSLKSKKSVKAVDDLKLRRSPRFSGANNKTNMRR